MKNYEKKSFFTSALLFFLPLITFGAIVLYMYHEDKIKDIEQSILYQMKDYTFDFKGDRFSLDIVDDDNSKEVFKIYHCKEGLCAYFKPTSSKFYLLKVIFTKEKYDELYKEFLTKFLKICIVAFFFIFFISISFAFYSLKPMREALHLLENFLKDLIHDLNTPSTSILLNSKLLKRRGDFEEIERIELSAKTISSLYKNLEFINLGKITKDENIPIEEIVKNKVEVLKKLYPSINFRLDLKPVLVKSNKNALERILENLMTNACKYNKKNGEVFIFVNDKKVSIEDTGVGIKNVNRVFDRYYKENERGLGIGMNIVKKLCDALQINIKIKSEVGKGTKVELSF